MLVLVSAAAGANGAGAAACAVTVIVSWLGSMVSALLDSPSTWYADYDDDGFADILVGAWGDDSNATDAGAAQLFYGGGG